MGQAEIMEVLKRREDHWHTVKEICPFCDASFNSVQNCLKRLRWGGQVYTRKAVVRLKLNRNFSMFQYKYKP